MICGIHARPASFDLTAMVRLEQSVVGFLPRAGGALERGHCGDRGRAGAPSPADQPSPALAEALDGFALMRSRAAIKVMLRP